jgi:hypothetical protein
MSWTRDTLELLECIEHCLEERRTRAKKIRFEFSYMHVLKASGDNMTFTMKFDKAVSALISAVDAAGNPSTATLSGASFTSSDPTIFTATQNATNPLQVDIVGVAVGTATLTAVAVATNADGSSLKITGTVTMVLTPDVPPAASLAFTFGTPTP